jgi:tRNA (guanosine-2'-O-)-methyltransferase
MNERRREKFRFVADRRQPDMTVILENVTDQHNIGAVIRSCDSVGVMEIYILNTEPHLQTKSVIIGKRTSMGARKWVDINYFTDIDACFQHVRNKYKRILGTHLDQSSSNLYALNLTEPVALLFGNEHSGLSEACRQRIDGNFVIPQTGMAESLNISVACAVTLYEAYRQRNLKGFYEEPFQMPAEEREVLYHQYLDKHAKRRTGRMVVKRKH